MAAVIDTQLLNHLGAVVQRVRSECAKPWDVAGIRSALEKALATYPFADVALVAIGSARDRHADTPAVIPHRVRQGWSGHDIVEPQTPAPPNLDGSHCMKCGLFVAPHEPHDDHCVRIQPEDRVEITRRGAAAARAALRTDPGGDDGH